MASKIKHIRSSVTGKQPTAGQLEEGQIALNTADGKVFMKQADNTVREITKQIHDEDTSVSIDESGASGNIVLTADGTNVAEINTAVMNLKVPVVIENADTITIKEAAVNGTNGITIKIPTSLNNSYNFTLPPTPGLPGQVLTTDGSGGLTFQQPVAGGHVIYVSKDSGDDANDGINKPVASIKQASILASSLVYTPVTPVTAQNNDVIQLLDANTSFIQAEVIAYIEYQIANTGGIWAGFTYDSATCSRDVGYIIEAIKYDLKYTGNSKSQEAGKSYYRGTTSTEEVLNNQKPQTVAALEYAKHIAGDIIQNIALTDDQDGNPLAPFQLVVTQTINNAYDEGNLAKADHDALWDEVIAILDGSPTAASATSYANYKYNLVTISIGTGDYSEVNPIIIPDGVSVIGDALRAVIIRPINAQEDMFRVRNATYLSGFTFRDKLDANGVPIQTYNFAVSFDDVEDFRVNRHVYTDLPIQKPIITISPYVQNCSIISFLGGNGCNIDGSKVFSPNIPINQIEAENPALGDVPEQNPSMVGNAFTILSFNGTGYRVTNEAYSQIVSCFQIFCKNGSYAQSGGYLSITNSATNFGTYALRASGYRLNSFIFDRGVIATNGVDGSFQTLDIIGYRRAPVEHFVTRFINTNDDDITDNFKENQTELTFSANSSTVNIANNKFVINAHGLLNGDRVRYDANSNPEIFGLYDETYYYVSLIDENEFKLYEDEELTNLAELSSTSSGTHKFVAGAEEFFINEIKDAHQVYQTLVLDPGSYSFTVGQEITGTVDGSTNNAYVYSWDNGTRTLVVSINKVVVGGEISRVKFTADSTIDVDSLGTTNIELTSTADRSDLYSATILLRSTTSGGQVQNIAQLPGQRLNLHRPSIVNSSGHTWEYSGSGTDYNALPKNGGQTNPDYEQYQDLPGRVYTSGTTELGDFKVGKFITAQNRTGNVTFTNKVSIAQLDSLQLSLSDVTIEAISTDSTLGDNDPGGASHARLTTQLAQRTFMNNRLGDFLDKQVTSSSVPGAVVQLNSTGKINSDLIPVIRSFSSFTLDYFEDRLLLADDIPAQEVLAGDNIIEIYDQETLTLSDVVTLTKGETVTQLNSNATGIVKLSTLTNTLVLVRVSGTFTTNPSDTLSGSVSGATGEYPISTSGIVQNQDNWFLADDNESQFLRIQDPSDSTVHNFVIGRTVKGAASGAEGVITEYREGVAVLVNTNSLPSGSGYSNDGLYINVSLTGGTGSGAKADITVNATGKVAVVDLVRGGSGYSAGDVLSAANSDLGGLGGGGTPFTVTLQEVENRLYVTLSGNFIKFDASDSNRDFIEDNNAITQTLDNVAFFTISFSGNSVNGEIDYVTNQILIADHGLINGDPIEYNPNGNTEIGGLSNGNVYFAKVIDSSTFEVYSTYDLAPSFQVDFTTNSGGTHQFRVKNVSVNGDRFYLPAHGYPTGTAIRLSSTNTPTGLTAGNFYFIGSVTTNSFTLHRLRNDAIDSVNGYTQQSVDITTVGAGDTSFTDQNATVIGTLNTSSTNPDNYASLNTSNIDAGNIVSGIISPSRLGTGSANQNTFLAGDSTFKRAVTNIKTDATQPISLVGDSFVEGGETKYFGSIEFQIDKVDSTLGDINYTNLGVSGFSKSQFTIEEGGFVSITSTANGGELDAATLAGQLGSYYLNPENLNRAIPITKGGTNVTGYNAGDILYAASALSLNTDALNRLGIGASGSVLASNGSLPAWTKTLSVDNITIADNLIVDTDTLVVDGTEHKVGMNTPTPLVTLDITATDAIRVPVGTTVQRPVTPKTGYVRYNTTNNTYEGYAGAQWVQLQATKDVDGDTFISAETTPGSDNDTLKFFAGGILVAELNSNGFADVKVGDILIQDSYITTTLSDGNLELRTSGSGIVDIQSGAAVASGLTVEGEVIINDSGSDVDLRIESNTEEHMIFLDASADALGIKTATPKATLQVEEMGIDCETASGSGTGNIKVAEFAIADFRTAKILIQVSDSTSGEYQAQEFLLVHDGTNVKFTEYAIIYTGTAALATFSTQISAGNVELIATPGIANTLDYKVAKTMITV
jgi:hypothetical protein